MTNQNQSNDDVAQLVLSNQKVESYEFKVPKDINIKRTITGQNQSSDVSVKLV